MPPTPPDPAAALRARLAATWWQERHLPLPDARPHSIGDITLLPHQVAALAPLRRRLARYRAALLADPPGLGKTYVALALAREAGGPILVIAPATLRERWRDAARECRMRLEFCSIEQLSAGGAPAAGTTPAPAFVILDEAHHFRTLTTRRRRTVRQRLGQAPALLLTATPVHNHTGDAHALLGMVHRPLRRTRARDLLGRLTVRRSLALLDAAGCTSDLAPMPATAPPRQLAVHEARDTHRARAIIALPPLGHDIRAREAHALVQLGLLRALASSDAALTRALRRRAAQLGAITDALHAGMAPDRHLLRAWHAGDDGTQLAMPLLLGTAPASDAATHALPDVVRQLDAIRQLLAETTGAADAARARVLRRLARWCRHPVVAFSGATSTVQALWQRLAQQPGIGLLTGDTARLASGLTTRADLLARLTQPQHFPSHGRLRLLLASDVIAEGLSLAGVGTVVHLDQPWTSARVAQRVGRAARLGAPVPVVRTLHLTTADSAPVLARLTALLHRKQRAMTRSDRWITGGIGDAAAATITGLARTILAAAAADPGAPSHGTTGRMRRAAGRGPMLLEDRLVLLERGDERRLLSWRAGRLCAADARTWYHALTGPLVCDAAAIVAVQARLSARAPITLASAQDPRVRARRASDARLATASPLTRPSGAARTTLARRAQVRATRDAPGAAPPPQAVPRWRCVAVIAMGRPAGGA